MGGPSLELMLEVFTNAYEQFIEDNRYAGLEPRFLHAKAMAHARDALQGTWPLTKE